MSKSNLDRLLEEDLYIKMKEVGFNVNWQEPDGVSKAEFKRALIIIAIRKTIDKKYLINNEGKFVRPELIHILNKNGDKL